MAKKTKERKWRKVTQWLSLPFLVMVIIGGYYWPYLGMIAVGLIAVFLLISTFRGRLYCGWVCPMGAFHERVLTLFSIKKGMPSFIKQSWFRWLLFAGMMSFLGYQLYMTGGHELKVASVFRMMWIISTAAAISIGIFFKPRSWCKICPMGSMLGIMGRNRYVVQVGEDCRQCGFCMKSCPIETYAGSYKEKGYVSGLDCMRCFNCVDSCPRGTLSL